MSEQLHGDGTGNNDLEVTEISHTHLDSDEVQIKDIKHESLNITGSLSPSLGSLTSDHGDVGGKGQ